MKMTPEEEGDVTEKVKVFCADCKWYRHSGAPPVSLFLLCYHPNAAILEAHPIKMICRRKTVLERNLKNDCPDFELKPPKKPTWFRRLFCRKET